MPTFAPVRAIYAAVDAAITGWTCDLSTDCCHFGRTGREPYLWRVEWELVKHSLAARGTPVGRRNARAVGALCVIRTERPCPLLDARGGCTVYATRPFGCRTFFCERALGPKKSLPRKILAELGKDVAALSRAKNPTDDGPRLISRWLESGE